MITILALTAYGGCAASSDQQSFSVYFSPYSAALDQQARQTVADASTFAKAHQRQPIVVTGYSAPADPKLDVDGLSAQRAEAVKQAMAGNGIPPNRIDTAADGTIDPQPLPNLAVRRVDISIGKPDSQPTAPGADRK